MSRKSYPISLVLIALVLSTSLFSQQKIPASSELPLEQSSARFSNLVEVDVSGYRSLAFAHSHRQLRGMHSGMQVDSSVQNPTALNSTSSDRPSRPTRATTTAAPAFTIPVSMASFVGLTDNNTSIPPDTTGAVGPQHVMVTLNSQVQILDRFGAILQTRSLATFWSPLQGVSTFFDPRVFYDPYGQRWVTAALSNPDSTSSSILLAVSNSSDPTGTWSYYKYSGDPNSNVQQKQYWADYTNLGFNKDWIAVSVNLIPLGGNTTNDSRILIINKADAYAGMAAPGAAAFVVNGSNSMVPAYSYDTTLDTLYFAEEWDNATGKLRVSTVTGPVGAESLSAGTAFVSSNSAWEQTSVDPDFAPQLGETRKISAGDSRLQNLVYRNGDLWASNTGFLPTGPNPTRCSIQFFQFSPAGALKQFGRVDDATGQTFYAFPGLAVNKDDFVMLGFSQFSASTYASAAYTYQAPGTTNQMSSAPIVYKAGTGPYNKDFGTGENRWGDFSVANVDPLDDTDLWTLQEISATQLPYSFPSTSRFNVWWLHMHPGDGTIASQPASVVFGTAATSRKITISNGSASAVDLNGLSILGPAASSYSFTTTCGATLASGGVCFATITFQPQTAGSLIAYLAVISSGTPSQLLVPLSGSAQDNGAPDSFPGLPLAWGTPVTIQASSMTADAADPYPSCIGDLVSGSSRSQSAWYSYLPDSDGSITFDASSSDDFVVSLWTPNRRNGLNEVSCMRAQPSSGIYSIQNAAVAVSHTTIYYIGIYAAPGSTSPIQFNLPSAAASAPLTVIDSGLRFFPVSSNGTDVQAIAITNSSPTNQPFAVSSSDPVFSITYAPETQCSPYIPAQSTCIATVHYTGPGAGTQAMVPHTVAQLDLSGEVMPLNMSMQATLPSDYSPFSYAYARTVDSLPFSDTQLTPAAIESHDVLCGTLVAPMVYTFTSTVDGFMNVDMGEYVVNVNGSDGSLDCYTQYGSLTDQGFWAAAGVTYTIEIGTDWRTSVPASRTFTLTGPGSVYALSPSPVFFGRFPYGGQSSPVKMTLTNSSDSPMTVAFPGAPFSVTNSTCGSSLSSASSCTFDLSISEPSPTADPYPHTSIFQVGNTSTTVSWISPLMTIASSVPSVDFRAMQGGASSPARAIVLMMKDNFGPVQISTTGDFAQTNDCALVTSQRPWCTVNVTFTPAVLGPDSGLLTIDYNLTAPSPSTLTIPLAGTGLPPLMVRPVRTPVPSQSSSAPVTNVRRPGVSSLGASKPDVSRAPVSAKERQSEKSKLQLRNGVY